MRHKVEQLRSLLRSHKRRITEYLAVSALSFVAGLGVIHLYVSQLGLDERLAKATTSATMGPFVFCALLFVWRDRRVALVNSAARWSCQRLVMTSVPHLAYLAMVGAFGFSYLEAQVGIALVWGLGIALPANYVLCHNWSLMPKAVMA